MILISDEEAPRSYTSEEKDSIRKALNDRRALVLVTRYAHTRSPRQMETEIKYLMGRYSSEFDPGLLRALFDDYLEISKRHVNTQNRFS